MNHLISLRNRAFEQNQTIAATDRVECMTRCRQLRQQHIAASASGGGVVTNETVSLYELSCELSVLCEDFLEFVRCVSYLLGELQRSHRFASLAVLFYVCSDQVPVCTAWQEAHNYYWFHAGGLTAFAAEVCSCLLFNSPHVNFWRFFRMLLFRAPLLERIVLQLAVPRVRVDCLRTVRLAYYELDEDVLRRDFLGFADSENDSWRAFCVENRLSRSDAGVITFRTRKH